MKAILGVDPGREKVGLAIISLSDGAILWRGIVPLNGFWDLPEPARDFELETIALGDSTNARRLIEILNDLIGDEKLPNVPIEMVDERASTLEARDLYWAAHPPRGWRRWVPLSLQEPPEPIDDFAAAVVARRLLVKRQNTS